MKAAPSSETFSERAHQNREIVYFLQPPETHSFNLYHDYTEERPGVGAYVNIVRTGSKASNPSARNLDTGASIPAQFVKGLAILKDSPDEKGVTGFEAGAYDALHVAVAAAKLGGTTRDGVLKGFQQLKDVPSVVYGTITLDQTTRRVQSPQLTPTILKGGAWAAYNG